ncbi:MAG: hypothetical protein DYG93_05440 [Leptolyngbya sp. PLA2]|nr:hypothetical protein [Leptolyngbya sp.]MCE7971092.1 hypothetical protein [Leptolyngbya sp. PL-A2]MCQ3940771.1 hypothetical protein [cyanobacterium CYA1]MCZ7634211.1 DinB family protein [Phycisphaerales bacterium]MDL1905086.1 hypothetical protein [Synechococcales cyanobacterium CNB]GIK19367.1 MAG: hypothetical protein BroJett004_15310 [Planctomycetota bacterium]
MQPSDPLHVLARFDRWATERLFAAYRALDDAALDRTFEIGLGSIRRTLVHVVANMEWWLDRADSRAPRPFNSEPSVSLDAIIDRYEHAWDDLSSLLSRSTSARLAEVIASDFEQPDGSVVTVRFIRAAVLLHVFNHGTHHRVQCLNMLRNLGVAPLPEIDLIDSTQETVHAPDR